MEKIFEIPQREKRKDKKKPERKNSNDMHWFLLEGISTIWELFEAIINTSSNDSRKWNILWLLEMKMYAFVFGKDDKVYHLVHLFTFKSLSKR